MFLYETKDIFDSEGNGLLKGLVIRTTPNGISDCKPVSDGEKIFFIQEDKDGIHVVESLTPAEPEVEINGKKYGNIESAIADAQDGDTITFAKDAEIKNIEIDKDITIDLAGNTVSSDTFELFKVSEGGKLTLTGNGTLEGPEGGQQFDSKSLIAVDGGELVIESGTFEATGEGSDGMYGVYVLKDGKVTFGTPDGNGPTITSWFAPIGANNTTAPVNVTIYGGTYTALASPSETDWWSYFCAPIYAAADGTYDIQGGTFNGYYGISDRYQNVNQNVNLGDITINASSGTDVFVDSKTGKGTGTERIIKSKTNSLTLPSAYEWVEDGDEFVVAKKE